MKRPIVVAVLAGIPLLGGAYFVLHSLKPAASVDGVSAEGAGAEGGNADFMKSFIAFFRDSCVSSAKTALTQNHVDASSKENADKVETYCSCAVEHVQAQLSVKEILAYKLDSSSEPAASKMKAIIKECTGKIGPMQ